MRERRLLNEYVFWITLISGTLLVSFLLIILGVALPETGLVTGVFFWIVEIIDRLDYLGIFLFMVAESALIPIPSEIVMPFAGFLVSKGDLSPWMVAFTGTIANLVGSLLAYWVGLRGGRTFVEKYGKYFLLSDGHLALAEKLFKKYGTPIILAGRMLPAVRTVISLPAGVGRMHKWQFAVYTFVGSLPWNLALTYVGVLLGSKWATVSHLLSQIEIPLLIVAVMIFLWFIRTGIHNDSGQKKNV